jgi:4-amino-4-deoxychorismate lyase
MMEFFESVKLLDGKLYNESYHLARLNRTLKNFGAKMPALDKLPFTNDATLLQGLFKYKIIYNLDEIIEVQISPYKRRTITKVHYVQFDNLNYSYKYADRAELNSHNMLLADDEEVVYIKHGMLTDAIYSNIAFFDGDAWFTPRHPLLFGTKRAQLIADGILHETVILKNDITGYEKISFINALNDLDDVALPIQKL